MYPPLLIPSTLNSLLHLPAIIHYSSTRHCTFVYLPLYIRLPATVHSSTRHCTFVYPPLYIRLPATVHSFTRHSKFVYPPLYIRLPATVHSSIRHYLLCLPPQITQSDITNLDCAPHLAIKGIAGIFEEVLCNAVRQKSVFNFRLVNKILHRRNVITVLGG